MPCVTPSDPSSPLTLTAVPPKAVAGCKGGVSSKEAAEKQAKRRAVDDEDSEGAYNDDSEGDESDECNEQMIEKWLEHQREVEHFFSCQVALVAQWQGMLPYCLPGCYRSLHPGTFHNAIRRFLLVPLQERQHKMGGGLRQPLPPLPAQRR